MRHSAHEATRRWLETGHLRGVMAPVIMDGKAADQALFAAFQRQSQMTLLTTPRNNSDPTVARQQLIDVLNQPQNRNLRQQRGQTVEPRPGVVKDIFALARCWMRGQRNNRWRVAAMGVAVQLHQARALIAHRSTWKITQEGLGLSKCRDPSSSCLWSGKLLCFSHDARVRDLIRCEEALASSE
jgi:hypothetical protein